MDTPKIKKRGRPIKATLNQQKIIEMAKVMMRNDSKIPSIRKLSSALDVDAMAIYYYFSNKDKLLEALTTSLITEIYEPKAAIDWQEELIILASSYLHVLRDYDGLLQTLLTMKSDSPAHVFYQRFQLIVKPLNLSIEQQKSMLDLVADYLHGFSLALSCDGSNTLKIEDIRPPLTFLFNSIGKIN